MEDTKHLKHAFDAAQEFLNPVLKRGTQPRRDLTGIQANSLRR